jgi:hypothetical protein
MTPLARLRAKAEQRAWEVFRRQHGAALPRPPEPGRLRKALWAAWGLLLGVCFMLAWLVALVVVAPVLLLLSPLLWAWRRLLGGEGD